MNKRISLSKELRDYVFKREMGLCACCGFVGNEVHHIKPVCFGGDDNKNNLILLCGRCHKDAPNDPKEFVEYLKSGGVATTILFGMICQKSLGFEKETGGKFSFQYCFNFGREMISWMREADRNSMIEIYADNIFGGKE